MRLIPNYIYGKIRDKEIKKAKILMKKVKINTVFGVITSSCWKHGLHYDVLVKNNELLLIKMCGRKENLLLKFHKSDMVFSEEYEKFISLVNSTGSQKGVYITTGVFEEKILKCNKSLFSLINEIKIEDGFCFIRRQLGLWRKSEDIFKYKGLSFFGYLPN